ncbi:hypothetical protein CXB49_11175 [Chromobacterium sp. ATCC 53434]|uniref:hypothetical protein n=1 Tax=Chromobacterium TaxID=535 RepID=UPI000C775E10|nr:hypothetical protein [Chromobacterium sp. ATCC 53434]AUH51336.1 hypothetical protein CXB49_11175 [Chromobacterium sp. ATCC 53434]
MSLRARLDALLGRCRAAQRRSEQALARLAREDEDLRREQDDIAGQRHGLRQLLQAQRPQGTVFDRGGLFALQRRQAVLRRQLQNLDLQDGELGVQRQRLEQLRAEEAETRSRWLRKEDKYQRWARLQRRRERLSRLRREEAEQEEARIWTW